ncbi:polyamine ABC transporter substrate-binding protein [Rhizobium sp. AG855]|uniref:polyamine ABC transporter substrate-binding protein n=1 Tax=Rhizobium sp. AG855 TaxID=2183898 RepID=UPI000E728904|nr:polyamine ABC transporter substrate-binding protein [Rhizobium sp. AG855]RKE79241.1 spermidine/putrescine-binding protein [Rhizobium sp. AG855]
MEQKKTSHLGRALLLASCLVMPAATAHADQLFIYNFSDYFAPDTISKFIEKTGIDARVDFFDSLEILETRLLAGGSGFDVVFPSATVGERLVASGALQPIDKSKLKNYGNLDPELLKLLGEHDSGNTYLVPYMWLTTGVAYNKAMIQERLPDAPVDSLAMVFDPKIAAKFADCGIGIVDAPNEIIPIALNYLGLDPYSANAEDLKKAEDLLMALRPNIRHMQSGKLIADMASGQLCLAVMWSGDVGIAAARADEAKTGQEIHYSLPKEGTIVSFDTMAIPADAANVDQALQFIDYILDPKVVADISNSVFLANANAGATALVDEAITKDPNIYPPAEVQAKLFSDRSVPPRQNRERTRIWTTFRAGQ